MFDCKAFTEQVFKLYAEDLRARILRVRFVLEDDPAVVIAQDVKSLRYLGEFSPLETGFELDSLLRNDGSVRSEEEFAEGVASALSVPLIDAAQTELRSEEDDPSKRVGAGQLWIVHRAMPRVLTLGAAQVHYARQRESKCSARLGTILTVAKTGTWLKLNGHGGALPQPLGRPAMERPNHEFRIV